MKMLKTRLAGISVGVEVPVKLHLLLLRLVM